MNCSFTQQFLLRYPLFHNLFLRHDNNHKVTAAIVFNKLFAVIKHLLYALNLFPASLSLKIIISHFKQFILLITQFIFAAVLMPYKLLYLFGLLFNTAL
jgi:hypothetical protein